MITDRITSFGFDFGAASVDRLARDEAKGVVYIGVTTPKDSIQIRVTKSGKISVSNARGNYVLEKGQK